MSINFSDVGRIGKDAVTRFTQGGDPVTGFSLAVDVGYGDRKQTLWLDVSAWGKRYEKLAEHWTKGAQIFVQGELGTREHDGKTYLTLRMADFKFAGSKDGDRTPQGSERTQSGATPEPGAPDSDFPDDNIPF